MFHFRNYWEGSLGKTCSLAYPGRLTSSTLYDKNVASEACDVGFYIASIPSALREKYEEISGGRVERRQS